MLDIVIFSKDRAAQLDLCLQSIYQNASKLNGGDCCINIVYTASTPEFQTGYDKLKEEYRSYHMGHHQTFFFGESHFGGFVEAYNAAMSSKNEYVLFFTDDDIVYRPMAEDLWPCTMSKMVDENLFTVSLRLGTNTFVQDQYRNTNCLIPDNDIQQNSKIRTWNYSTQPDNINFAYPFSVDGHFFFKSNVNEILSGIPDWYNPNSLEGKAQHNLGGMFKFMGCFEHSYVVNTPMNRVQETCTNKAGQFFNQTAESLNERYLSGDRLSLDNMDFSTIIGCHQEIKLEWEN